MQAQDEAGRYLGTFPVATTQLTVTARAGACEAGTTPALNLQAPRLVAYNRKATITVQDNGTGLSYGSVLLTERELSVSPPFFSYTLTSSQVRSLSSAGKIKFYIQLDPTDGPAQVSLTYLQDEDGAASDGQCIDQRTATVTPTAGTAPTARFANLLLSKADAAGVVFSDSGGCALTRITPESLSVTGPKSSATITTADECAETWTDRGRIPGISVRQHLQASGSQVDFAPSSRLNREYRLTVRVAGRIIKRGWLSATYFRQPPERVYQDTDAFVNYCIDSRKTIHSYHLQLYSVRPGFTLSNVEITTQR
jgi:hypothetical protein